MRLPFLEAPWQHPPVPPNSLAVRWSLRLLPGKHPRRRQRLAAHMQHPAIRADVLELVRLETQDALAHLREQAVRVGLRPILPALDVVAQQIAESARQ